MKKCLIPILKILSISIFIASMVFIPVSAVDNTKLERYYSLDISGLANAAFSPNPLGLDKTDFQWITPGHRTYMVGSESVPFTVIDPSENSGKGVLITNGGSPTTPVLFLSKFIRNSYPQENSKKCE